MASEGRLEAGGVAGCRRRPRLVTRDQPAWLPSVLVAIHQQHPVSAMRVCSGAAGLGRRSICRLWADACAGSLRCGVR